MTLHPRVHTNILVGLMVLFVGRVLAQLVQFFFDLPFLPPFDSWQSGAVPYVALFIAQIIIIVLMVRTIVRYSTSRVIPNARAGTVLLVLGSSYFLSMLGRAAAGLTIASHLPWFQAWIPTFFHLILASFLLVTGHFHVTHLKKT